MHIGKLGINSKIDDQAINAIMLILENSDFLEWRRIKAIYLKKKFDNAKNLVSDFKDFMISMDFSSETHNRRILNAFKFLTDSSYFDCESKTFIIDVNS